MSKIIRIAFIHFLVNYEYAHNPDLFNHTRLGKLEQMKRTMQEGFSQGSLSKAGASAIGFNDETKSVTSASSQSQRPGATTQHWKSTYQGVVETTTSQ